MSVFIFERPAHAAPRLWLERPGRPPVLLSPLACHRELWGDLYDLGANADGCRLLAATMAVRCGYTARAAAVLAPIMVRDWLRFLKKPVARFERKALKEVLALLSDNNYALIMHALAKHRGNNHDDN